MPFGDYLEGHSFSKNMQKFKSIPAILTNSSPSLIKSTIMSDISRVFKLMELSALTPHVILAYKGQRYSISGDFS